MNNIVLGKYVPYNTFLHRLDPRTKIISLIIFVVAIFMNYGSYVNNFIINGVGLILVIVLLLVSKISIKSIFSSLKMLWFTILFLFLINIFIPNGNYSYVLFSINSYNFYLESIFQAIKIILRIVIMILISLILTSTTKPTDLSYAFEWYLTPFKYVKLPVSEIAMIISLALRFIPTILEDAIRIKNAQSSRGIDFEHGSLKEKFKGITSLIVPLLISSLSRSDDLAFALSARGYIPGEKQTRYRILNFKYTDLLSFLTLILFCSLLFTLAYFQLDILKYLFNFENSITILGAKA